MEVEDDNVYIGRMTTDVSGNSGLGGQSKEKFYGLASMVVLLWKYYELKIRILTSGTSEIVKRKMVINFFIVDTSKILRILYYFLSKLSCS